MLIRLAYLAVLWIFVLGAISVIRSDMFGARVGAPATPSRREQRNSEKEARKRPAKPPRGTPSRLTVLDGPSAGESVPLDQLPLLIGRGPDAAIRRDDDYVSTRHARIAASGDQWFVEDLGSTNGTYLGNQRLTQPTTIMLGSQVRIGKTVLELRK